MKYNNQSVFQKGPPFNHREALFISEIIIIFYIGEKMLDLSIIIPVYNVEN